MPSIRQRKTGLYEARLSFKGKYFSVYDRNLKKLKTKITKKFKELEKEFNRNKSFENTIQKKRNEYSLKEWYELWLELDKKPFLSQGSIEKIEIYFNKHILPILQNLKLSQITTMQIKLLLNKIDKPRTNELVFTYLKACLEKARKEGYITNNPCEFVTRPKKVKNVGRALTAEEQEKLLNYLKENNELYYNICLLYLCTGCRRNELLNIDLNKVVKNNLLVEGTKTETSVRYVKVTSEILNILKTWLPEIKKIHPQRITGNIKYVFDKLGIKDASLHSLRHSFATNHYYLGTQAKQVQLWLGHSTLDMTLNIYTNPNPLIEPKQEKELILKLYNNYYYYTE